MDVDPLASMRCWAITLELGGWEFELPALPAVDWWPVLTTGNVSGFLDDLVSTDTGDPTALDDLLLSGEVTGADLTDAVADAIEAATGRSAHVSFVLAAVAESSWNRVGGQLAREGFRWDVQPIGAALDAVYAIIMEGLEKENREKFTRMLANETLTGGKRKEPDREKILNDFETMAGPRPKPMKASGGRSGGERPRTRRRPQPPRPDDRSDAPISPPGPPAGNDRPASSGARPAGVSPASGTAPPPPPAKRSRPRSRVAGSEAGPTPTT